MMELFFITQFGNQSEIYISENCTETCNIVVSNLINIKSSILNKNLDFVPSCLPFATNMHSHSELEFVWILKVLVFKIKHFQSSQPGILNLSHHTLTQPETELLEKGLNYCPTQRGVDLGKLNLELDRFFRSVRLALFFDSPSDSSKESDPGSLDEPVPFSHSDMKKPSTWTPPPVSHLDHIISMIQNDTLSHKVNKSTSPNLTQPLYNALQSLSQNKEIIIKPADKGRKVVIMNRQDYIAEGLRQLSDRNFYTPTDTDLTPKHVSQIKLETESMYQNGEISKQTLDYLNYNCERTAQFYMLPKIHKSLTNPPGRPIVSGNDSPTEKISQLVDLCINPLVPKIKSYLRDTTHLLQKLSEIDHVPPDALLVTLDVTSLYTNIPHHEGIQAVADYLSRYRPPNSLPSNQSLLKLLSMVLTKNNFEFNGQHFLQTNGTAMGTRVAPSYANIFMARFEEKFVYTYHLAIYLWLRYIDDIFMIWLHGISELKKFVSHLNSRLPHLKFTLTYSNTSIVMLDTTILIHPDGTLAATLHTKETDSHNYLKYDSDHPRHIKDAIPYSQFLRIRRICSNENDYIFHSLILFGHFSRREYPTEILCDAFERSSIPTRTSLLTNEHERSPPVESKNRNIYCVLTHNRANPPVRTYIERHWPLLGRREATRGLTNMNIIYSHKRSPNIRDILVRAKLPSQTPQYQLPTCKARNRACNYCPLLNLSGKFLHPATGRRHSTKQKVSCQSNNLVYLLECNICHILYVGQTKNAIMKRTYQHLRDIRLNNPNSTVARHYNAHVDLPAQPLRVHILDFIGLPRKTLAAWHKRLEREKIWISRLNTLVPSGLNLLE